MAAHRNSNRAPAVDLHPEVQAITDSIPPRNFADSTVEEARATHGAGAAARPAGPDMVDVTEIELGGCSASRYTPRDSTGAGVVFFHGGGWVLGSRVTHEGTARHLADQSGATVYSVEYRLAPEHPFPAAFDDAVASTSALLRATDEPVDRNRIAVAGDSAGGNLAAATTIALRGTDGPALRAQLLVYPALDPTMSMPSHRQFAAGPFLSSVDMAWFYERYALDAGSNVGIDDWRLAPLAAADLSDLPTALVITAENDVLRDEGEAYAQALASAGVDAAATRVLGVTHGFFGWTHAAAPARAAMLQAAAWLRAKLA